jgi:hypothetical protein
MARSGIPAVALTLGDPAGYLEGRGNLLFWTAFDQRVGVFSVNHASASS